MISKTILMIIFDNHEQAVAFTWNSGIIAHIDASEDFQEYVISQDSSSFKHICMLYEPSLRVSRFAAQQDVTLIPYVQNKQHREILEAEFYWFKDPSKRNMAYFVEKFGITQKQPTPAEPTCIICRDDHSQIILSCGREEHCMCLDRLIEWYFIGMHDHKCLICWTDIDWSKCIIME